MVSLARTAATIGCLVLIGCGAPQDTPAERLFASHNMLRHAGFTGLGPISTGEVTPEQSHRMRALLMRDACYVLAVFGQDSLHDVGVMVVSPDESQLAEDRGVGDTAVVSFCTQRAGEHQVTVSAEAGSGMFEMAYWVAGEAAAREAGGGNSLTLGRPVQGTLPVGERYVDYSLRVEQRRLITIDLESRDFDAYLYLLREGVEIDRNDDGGQDLNSRITLPLEPGNYTIRVSSFMERGSGQFILQAR